MTTAAMVRGPELGLVRPLSRQAVPGARPFYMIGGIGGHVQCYSPLCRALRAERQSFGVIQPVAIGDAPLSHFDDFVAPMTAAIAEHGDAQRLLFVGHSFGGLVAYEIACRMAAEGRRVGVVMLDTLQPHGLRQSTLRAYTWLRARAPFAPVATDREKLGPRAEWISKQQLWLARTYDPPRSDVALAILCASTRGRMDDLLIGMDRQWSRRARVVLVRKVAGTDHKNISGPTTGAALRDALDAVESALS